MQMHYHLKHPYTYMAIQHSVWNKHKKKKKKQKRKKLKQLLIARNLSCCTTLNVAANCQISSTLFYGNSWKTKN